LKPAFDHHLERSLPLTQNVGNFRVTTQSWWGSVERHRGRTFVRLVEIRSPSASSMFFVRGLLNVRVYRTSSTTPRMSRTQSTSSRSSFSLGLSCRL